MMQTVFRRLAVVLLAWSICVPSRSAFGQQRSSDFPTGELNVEQLIERLGSEDYFVRRGAEQQLIRIGPDAFDALKSAEQDPDLEVSSRASYILQQIRVQWRRPNDPIEVRKALTRYEDLPDDRRWETIRRIAALPRGQGAAALGRIARFDGSAQLARRAALALIRMDPDQVSAAIDSIDREIGGSERAPVQWLRALLAEHRDPESAPLAWRTACRHEVRRFLRESPDTDWSVLLQLWDHELEFCNRRKLVEETAASLIHFIETGAKRRDAGDRELAGAIQWCIQAKRWAVLEILEKRYAQRVREQRELIYYLATAYRQQGREELAEKTADRAYQLVADDDERRRRIASRLAGVGQLAWAQREWQYVIDNFSEVDANSVIARFAQAGWHFDRLSYKAAAEVLAPTADAIDANKKERERLVEQLDAISKAQLQALSKDWFEEIGEVDLVEGSLGLEDIPDLNDFAGRRDYYLACHYDAEGDYESQRRHLELSAARYELNIDVLIAMYHSQGADEAFQTKTAVYLKRAKRRQLAEIERLKEHSGERYAAGRYNEWAWLTANTEGDFQKAIRFSRRSLELRPDEPAFLDTLGRCYYAAGDYKNAVKYQRRAIELEPRMQVMRRQLELFEQALERHPNGNPTKPSKESPQAIDPSDGPGDSESQSVEDPANDSSAEGALEDSVELEDPFGDF